ncbi:hypothetical protein Hanom_Chr04g00350441 [Helianthus anomalus]
MKKEATTYKFTNFSLVINCTYRKVHMIIQEETSITIYQYSGTTEGNNRDLVSPYVTVGFVKLLEDY